MTKKQKNKALQFTKIKICERVLEVPVDFLNKNLAPLGRDGITVLPFHQQKAYMDTLQKYVLFWQVIDRDIRDVDYGIKRKHNSGCQAEAVMMGLLEVTIKEDERKDR